jgi:hypothetical protein
MPTQPANGRVTGTTINSIGLAWDDTSSNEDGFRIYKTSDLSTYTLARTVGPGATGFTDADLPCFSGYLYQVRAYNAAGESTPAVFDLADTRTEPCTPPAVDRTSLDFGAVRVGTTSDTQTVRLINTAGAALMIGYISIADGGDGHAEESTSDFSQTNTCQVQPIPAGGSCTVSVAFAPTASGDRSTTLYIAGTFSGDPLVIALQGSGQAPPDVPAAPTSPRVAGTTASTISLEWQDGSGDEDGFRIERSVDYANWIVAATLGPGVQTFTDVGLPCSMGYIYGVIAFNEAGDSPSTEFNWTQTYTKLCVAPSFSPDSLDFGTEEIGTSSLAQTVTLTNQATTTMRIWRVDIEGANATDFAHTTTCLQELPAGATCTISVTFTPGAGGQRRARIVIEAAAEGLPFAITLQGIGSGDGPLPPPPEHRVYLPLTMLD